MRTAIVVILSFVAGAGASYFFLIAQIEAAAAQADASTSAVLNFTAAWDDARAVLDLEQSTEIIGFVVAQKKRADAPSAFVGEQLLSVLNQKIATVERRVGAISDDALKKKATFQLDEARRLADDIQFVY